MDRLLPRLQLVFALLFALTAMFSPLILRQAQLALWTVVLAGFLLAVVTLRIGWRLEIEKSPVIYPFKGWSVAILKRLLPPKEARALQAARSAPSPAAQRALGIGSLIAGSLLVVALIAIASLVLFA